MRGCWEGAASEWEGGCLIFLHWCKLWGVRDVAQGSQACLGGKSPELREGPGKEGYCGRVADWENSE